MKFIKKFFEKKKTESKQLIIGGSTSGKEEEIKVVDINSIFNKTRDIDKFIDEYREFIVWMNDKYPSFKEDIKNDYWIQRIIKEHDEILVDLRKMINGEKGEPEYLQHNREKTSRIYEGNNT